MIFSFFKIQTIVLVFIATISLRQQTLAYTFNGFSYQDLTSSVVTTFIQDTSNWSASALVGATIYSPCGTSYLLGGFAVIGTATSSSGQYFQRTYTNLPTHNMIFFSLTLYELDSLTITDYFQMTFGTKTFDSWKQASSSWGTSNACGVPTSIDLINVRVFGRVSHSGSTILVKFTMMNSEPSVTASYGFRDINIIVAAATLPSATTETMCATASITLPSSQCQCPEGQYYASSCSQCDSRCSSCFGPSAQECYQCAVGSGWNGTQCVLCDSSCATCNGIESNQCTSCSAGNALYNNAYCIPAISCVTPMVPSVDSYGNALCTSACNPTQYMYWDTSCDNSCNSPLVATTVTSFIKTCSYPCLTSQYLYSNGSCETDCTSPFVPSISKARNFCSFPCASSQYLYWDNSCIDNCPYPLVTTAVSIYNYCNYPCATSEYLYWDRSCGSSCNFPLILTVNHSRNVCTYQCPSTQFLYWDGTCNDLCPSPLVSSTSNSRKFCNYTCSSSQYLYWDGTCNSTCPLPLVSSTINGYNLCNYPCSSLQFLYWDGSCDNSCASPLIVSTINGKNLCQYSCLTAEFLYSNGTCYANCTTPNTPSTLKSRNFCRQPCTGSNYYFPNGSCLATCPSPMIVSTQNLDNACIWPCSDPNPYYYTTDKTCKSSCSDPYEIVTGDFGLSCNLPLSTEDKRQISNIVSVTSATNTVATTGLALASMASSSNPSMVTAGSLVKVLEYTRYLNVTHSPRLEATFLGFEAPDGVFDSPKLDLSSSAQSGFQDKSPPIMFQKYNINPSFIIGYWSGLVSLMILFLIAGVLVVCNRRIKQIKDNKILKWSSHKLAEAAQNYFVGSFYDAYSDIVLFACLQYQSVKFAAALSIISLVAAILIVVLGIVVLYLHIRLLRKYQIIRREEEEKGRPSEESHKLKEFKEKYSGIKMLYHDFKDISLSRQAFLVFFTVRSIVTALIITLLHQYPLVQAILFTTLSVIMLVYVLVLRPFEEILDFLQQITFELTILAVNVSMLVMAILDLNNEGSSMRRYYTGEVVIIANIIAQFLPNLFLVLKIIVFLRKLYKKLKEKRQKAKVGPAITPVKLPQFFEPVVDSREVSEDNKSPSWTPKSRLSNRKPFNLSLGLPFNNSNDELLVMRQRSGLSSSKRAFVRHAEKFHEKDIEKGNQDSIDSAKRVPDEVIAKYSDWVCSPNSDTVQTPTYTTKRNTLDNSHSPQILPNRYSFDFGSLGPRSSMPYRKSPLSLHKGASENVSPMNMDRFTDSPAGKGPYHF